MPRTNYQDENHTPEGEARLVVVVPAHDEGSVIGRCLRTLLADAAPGEFDVLVAANGCSDDTARVAAEVPGVRVLEIDAPGKTNALNEADAVLEGFPRLYLDADVELPTSTAREIARVLDSPGVLAASGRPAPSPDGVSWPVRWHYEIWSRLPVTLDAYVGSGVYAVSAAGHRRVSPFPDVIAEDAYVRRAFARHERRQVAGAFVLHPPRTVRALLRRAARSRAGNTQLETGALAPGADESARGVRGLVPLARDPRDWPKVVTFAVITVLIRIVGAQKTRRGDLTVWDRDESSR